MSDTGISANNDGKFRQYLAACIVNLITVSYGTLCGWPSPVIPQLLSEHSPVGNLPMSDEDTSWIGGFLCIGGLASALFSGSLADKMKRKQFIFISSIPLIISLLMNIFATNYKTLYASRFIAGIGGAMTTFIVPCYTSEIASEQFRGALGSYFMFAFNIGILIAFIAGAYLSYTIFGVFLLIFPLVFLITFYFMPETPICLVRRNHLDQANKSLMFLRGNNKLLAAEELSRIQSQIRSTRNLEKKSGFYDRLNDRATLKGITISSGLIWGQQLGGIFAMVSYAETIFKLSGSSLPAEISAIIIGSIQVFGSYLSTLLMERAGRRPLILISCLGMSICHLTCGSFFYFQNTGYDLSIISWLPVVALSVYMIAYCLGMGPGAFVVASEIFHVDAASVGNTICISFLWISSFVVIELFSPMINLIGIDGCFFIFGLFCTSSFVFSFCLLPETKGRTREDIIEELSGIVKSKPSFEEQTYVPSSEDAESKKLVVSEQV